MTNFSEKTSLIWSIADLLRGGWKQHEYQDVILPLVVLKRLDDVLKDTKQDVLARYNSLQGQVDVDPILKKTSKVGFYNISEYDFAKLLDAPNDVAKNLRHYMSSFSSNVEEIIEKFDFENQLSRLSGGNLLYLILKELNKVNLHPSTVSNHEMGYIFEELIRKFAEMSNETAGEHYTPREVIHMMVEILFAPDEDKLKREHIIKTVYDPCCGTGGMLTVSKDHILETINSNASVYLYGQELNSTTYAICNADMLIKGEDPEKIKGGEKDHSLASTLSNDQFEGQAFDYCLTNPPFGVEWKKDKEAVEREAERGFAGRFGAGTPRISDGQLLFLQHLISKMKNPIDGGSRLAIVMNGSPLFTGNAGGGESEIRRWILENDMLEAIVALPDQLFYNTGIYTYVWFLSNNKSKEREGKVQLIDARTFFKKMRKSLGNKRHEISDEDRKKILELYEAFEENEYCKIFPTEHFGYRQVTVDRPLRLNFQVSPERVEAIKLESQFAKLSEGKNQKKIEEGTALQQSIFDTLAAFDDTLYKNRDEFMKIFDEKFKDMKLGAPLKKAILNALSEQDETAGICTDNKGNPEADSNLRDTENVPLGEDIYEYFEREVKPYVPDAWIDEKKRDAKDKQVGIVGYEIPLTRYFYTYEPPRALEDIEGEIEEVENELLTLLKSL
ncbi:MAG: restriction endonuclease subunit M [Candidatus Magasanikbacteria bacterium CG11_big_fil_rev_8_21_14_0_20_39_34]|uniref:site-specific DNA-methyltransferase (adenine-specific) n=1 Tax=Candidatus Magasanikbacteria bacterium CG11_big_fil_rev_8_21_14_0_20_39_34 TaxID=1974653 RepID=A0A2H0N4Y9_9BACT|nr:MAG: restriction endonuclease subunit M [Candidatus Magasanikbacteria bacterium CG11_big_fil_rev_8_21_14_0_20_39_34]